MNLAVLEPPGIGGVITPEHHAVAEALNAINYRERMNWRAGVDVLYSGPCMFAEHVTYEKAANAILRASHRTNLIAALKEEQRRLEAERRDFEKERRLFAKERVSSETALVLPRLILCRIVILNVLATIIVAGGAIAFGAMSLPLAGGFWLMSIGGIVFDCFREGRTTSGSTHPGEI